MFHSLGRTFCAIKGCHLQIAKRQLALYSCEASHDIPTKQLETCSGKGIQHILSNVQLGDMDR